MRTLIILSILTTMTISSNIQAQTKSKKILVAYYSWSGNTEAVAKHIQKVTGADVFIIEPQQAYPTDYKECTDVAKKEINSGTKPALKGNVTDFSSYDIVFVGTPNWWSTMAPPVLSFLHQYDFAGKTVIPFVTHGGGREARCFSDMQKSAPAARFLKGLAIAGNRAANSEAEVEKWIKELNL